MINHFRDDMPQPIVGIGHSIGGAQLSVMIDHGNIAPSTDSA